jgi:hypothetical protein
VSRYEPHGRKEIAEAVAVAALVALAEGLVHWGLRALEESAARRAKQARKRAKRAEE